MQSPDYLKHLLEALNCGALMLDREGVIVWANQRVCRMMQRACGDVIGKPIESFYDDPADRQHLHDAMQRFTEDREEEFHLPLPDGGRVPIIYSSKLIPGESTLDDHRIVTLIDVSRQKNAEEALREQYHFITQMSDTLLQQALELKNQSKILEERVLQRTAELHEAHKEAIYMLAIASEAKDVDTGKHVRRIQKYSKLLAQQLGLSTEEAETIGYSSILHDIGKIHVPDRILTKPGPLDDDERRQMQEHTLAGERILAPSAFFTRARKIARSHHENWDGSGYPDRMAGDAIPLEARIVHVADVYDALRSPRVYKEAWSSEKAVATIVAERGRMFEPVVIDAFESLVRSGAFNGNSLAQP